VHSALHYSKGISIEVALRSQPEPRIEPGTFSKKNFGGRGIQGIFFEAKKKIDEERLSRFSSSSFFFFFSELTTQHSNL